MIKHVYSNDFETYEIIKFGNFYKIMKDGIFSEKDYKKLKDAKKDIDDQAVYF